jgi:hypothetical protein
MDADTKPVKIEPPAPEPAPVLKGLVVLGAEDAEACSDGSCGPR